jgi:hypothetical protein
LQAAPTRGHWYSPGVTVELLSRCESVVGGVHKL